MLNKLEEGFTEPPEGDTKGLYNWLVGKNPRNKRLYAQRLNIASEGICYMCGDDYLPLNDRGICTDCSIKLSE